MIFLITYLMFTSCLTFVTVNGKPSDDTETYKPLSPEEQFEIDSDKSLQLLLRFAKKINSISSYPESQWKLVILKLLEIHDELLELFLSDDSHVNDLIIKLLLEYLSEHISRSGLLRNSNRRIIVRI